jgi:hypothetical protein
LTTITTVSTVFKTSGVPESIVTNTITTTKLFVDFLSVKGVAGSSTDATVSVKTLPGAKCTVKINGPNGLSTDSRLKDKTADKQGSVSWTWSAGPSVTGGVWNITVAATLSGETVTQNAAFTH